MDSLNEDVLYFIFSQLGLLEKVRLEGVCRRWHSMLQRPRAHSNTHRLNAASLLKRPPPHLNKHHFESAVVGALRRCGPCLAELTFGGDHWLPITPPILTAIATHCPRLTRIDMACTRISGDVFPLLEQLASQLRELSVEEASWPEGAVCLPLGQMHCLERVNLRKFPGPLDALGAALSGQLRSVDLSATSHLSPETLVQFLHSHCEKQLRELVLCPLPRLCTPDTLQPLIDAIGCVTTLEVLSIGYMHQHGSGPLPSVKLDPLATLTPLKSLYIKECPFLTGEQLSAVLRRCSSQLRDLTLSDCPLLKDNSSLSHCQNLRALQVERSDHLADSHLTLLAQHCPRLRRLQLDRCCRVTARGVNGALRVWRDIREVELSNGEGIGEDIFSCNNDDDGTPWRHLHRLQTLSLSGTRGITNASLRELANLEGAIAQLRELDVSHNTNIDSSAITHLHSKLRGGGRAAQKPLLIYAFQTGITAEVEDSLRPEIELLF